MERRRNVLEDERHVILSSLHAIDSTCRFEAIRTGNNRGTIRWHCTSYFDRIVFEHWDAYTEHEIRNVFVAGLWPLLLDEL